MLERSCSNMAGLVTLQSSWLVNRGYNRTLIQKASPSSLKYKADDDCREQEGREQVRRVHAHGSN